MTISHPNFIQNKYFKLYVKLVTESTFQSNQYTEIHHIIPKSFGGTDDISNLIRISSRVHYLCHYLLTKFTTGDYKHKMITAFNMMHTVSEFNNKRYRNSRLYESNRKHMSETMRFNQTGVKNSQYGSIWMTNSIIDVSRKFRIEELNEAIEQGWNKGRKSKTFINKMTEINSNNKPFSCGKYITIYKNDTIIKVKEVFYYRDYAIDGWKILLKIYKSNTKSIKIKSIHTNENLTIREEQVLDFIKTGKWTYGFHNPNHKGTRDKTYKWINGKKVFD